MSIEIGRWSRETHISWKSEESGGGGGEGDENEVEKMKIK
jgi:hypothetical protein